MVRKEANTQRKIKEQTSTGSNEALKKAILAAEAQTEKKAEDIVVIDVRDVCTFSDYFVICTGLSSLQFKAIADSIESSLRKMGFKPYHIDGLTSQSWLIMDYSDVIIHVFSPEARSYYELERLWGDGTFIDWESEHKKIHS